jgi:hypothetical protein
MKEATVKGQLTQASPNAPKTGTCPHCEHPVTLRRRGENWHWRHQPGAPTTCPARFNPTRSNTANHHPNVVEGKPTNLPANNTHLAPVLVDNLDELIAISKEVGANVLNLPDTPVTLTLTGPGVVILATPYPSTNEESR